MYHYKASYLDHTFARVSVKNPLTSPKQVCTSCCKIERKNGLWALKEKIIEKLYDIFS